jgi:hypothetical protein
MWSKYKHEEAHVIIWYQILSCGTKCFHVGPNVIMWDQMLSCGTKCYHVEQILCHVGLNFIMRSKYYHEGQKTSSSCDITCYYLEASCIIWSIYVGKH